MIVDTEGLFARLLKDFYDATAASELDQRIVEHAIDKWPMGRLANEYDATPAELHRRRRHQLTNFRDYLIARGYENSADVLGV